MDDIKNMGLGALPSPEDTRDHLFAAPPGISFDWDLGFDIEMLLGYRDTVSDEEFWGKYGREGWGLQRYKEIRDICVTKGIQPRRLLPNNQNGSGSCVGQSTTKYSSIINHIRTRAWTDQSARDMYSAVTVGYGAYIRTAMDRLIKIGVASEELVSSYENGQPPSEAFMHIKPQETPEVAASRARLISTSYNQVVNSGNWMDDAAWAMLLNFGLVAGLNVSDQQWGSEYPQLGNVVGGHAILGGKAVRENGKNYIAFLNSWGDGVGRQGWQKLGNEYFTAPGWVFEIWTAINKLPGMDRLMGYKTVKNPTVYVYVGSTLVPISSWQTFTKLGGNEGSIITISDPEFKSKRREDSIFFATH